MTEYRRIIRRTMATAVAMSFGLAGSNAFAQSGHIQNVGFFGKMFGCKSCETAPACQDCETIVTPLPVPSAQPAPQDQPSQPPAAPEAAPMDDSSMLDLAAAFDAGAASGFSAPNMLGDLSPFQGSFNGQSSSSSSSLQARQKAAQRYKVADNTSPIPRTRVFYNYNYFSNIFGSNGDLHRNVLGAEIAFLDNRASFEIRQSLNSFAEFDDSNGTEAGNLVAVMKCVLYQNEEFLFSGGMSAGFHVGPTVDGAPGGNHIIAPFLGYLWQPAGGNTFVLGFNQIDFPTDGSDQSVMHTDIGGGFWLRQNQYDSLISGIAPTVELHLYTPLGDAPTGSLTGLVYDDVLNMTTGVTLVLRDNATLAVAMGLPLTERDDYDFEAQVQFNLFWGSSSRGYPLPR